MSFSLIPKNFVWWDEDELWPSQSYSSPNGLSVSEDDKNIFIEAAVPGIDPKNVEVTFDQDTLWIKAETKEEEKDPKKKYYRRQSRSFSYRVAIPGNIDTSIEPVAACKNGIMTITFTKSQKPQPKKIPVKSLE